MKHFLRSHGIFLLFFLGYICFSLVTYRSYGATIDEWSVYARGEVLGNKLRDDVMAIFSAGSSRYSNIEVVDNVLPNLYPVVHDTLGRYAETYNYTYSNWYPAVLYYANPAKDLDTNHLLNMLFSGTVFIVLYALLYQTYKNQWYALMGPILLVLTPRFFGDMPANPKDIPFAVLYCCSLAIIVFTRSMDARKRILITGLMFGLTFSVRFVGVGLLVIYVLFSLFIKPEREGVGNTLVEVFLIGCIGMLLLIITVPFVGLNPIQHGMYLLAVESNFPWNMSTLSFGQPITPHNTPWYYVPGWFIYTTPVAVLALFAIGLCHSVFFLRKENLLVRLFIVSFACNVVMLIIITPTLYDGVRHLAFLIPQGIVFSVVGLITLAKQKNVFRYTLIPIGVSLMFVLYQYATLFPYHVLYFNEFAGGLHGAYQRFETDYWASSYKEAVMWFLEEVGDNEVRLYSCGHYLEPYLPDTVEYVYSPDEADYAICTERFGRHDLIPGTVIHTVSRQNVPLSHVIQVVKP